MAAQRLIKLFYRKLRTLWHIPLQQKKLIVVSFFLCGIARAAIKTLSFQKLNLYFGEKCHGTLCSTRLSPAQISQALLIKRAIRIAAQYTPWISNCLSQAMVAKFFCDRYNIPYMFYIGFSAGQTPTKKLEGHAWVTAGPIAVTGGHGFVTHRTLLSYTSSLCRPFL